MVLIRLPHPLPAPHLQIGYKPFNGPFEEKRSHGTNTPYWMVNDAKGQEKQGDYIPQKANILSFQGSTALLGLHYYPLTLWGFSGIMKQIIPMESNMDNNRNW